MKVLGIYLVNDKDSPNSQGFWRVGVGVGVRGRNFLPSKNPYPCRGYGGYESDQIWPSNTWTLGAIMTDVKDSLLLQLLKYYLLVFTCSQLIQWYFHKKEYSFFMCDYKIISIISDSTHRLLTLQQIDCKTVMDQMPLIVTHILSMYKNNIFHHRNKLDDN